MNPHLYVLTETNLPNLHNDDQGLVERFSSRGIKAVPVIWDKFEPPQNAHILIRTPWDYPLKLSQFKNLLDRIDAARSRLINSTDIVRWNIDKMYMKDLAAWSIPSVPTVLLPDFKIHDVRTPFDFPLVLKPRFGASGRDTFLIENESELSKCEALQGRDVLAQPYMPSIKSEGEYSFILFNGEFSHAVLKTAKGGEFRIQEEHGGRVDSIVPSRKDVETVESFLRRLPFKFPYLRVDLVRHNDTLLIMELEAIEPQLFFRTSAPSLEKFVDIISSQIKAT